MISIEKLLEMITKEPLEEEIGCTCQECGSKYKVDLIVPDELWEQIKPEGKDEGAGLLCGSCMMQKIEEISGCDYWRLEK